MGDFVTTEQNSREAGVSALTCRGNTEQHLQAGESAESETSN